MCVRMTSSGARQTSECMRSPHVPLSLFRLGGQKSMSRQPGAGDLAGSRRSALASRRAPDGSLPKGQCLCAQLSLCGTRRPSGQTSGAPALSRVRHPPRRAHSWFVRFSIHPAPRQPPATPRTP